MSKYITTERLLQFCNKIMHYVPSIQTCIYKYIQSCSLSKLFSCLSKGLNDNFYIPDTTQPIKSVSSNMIKKWGKTKYGKII